MISVLFVCLGNICRSPTAHGVLRQKLRDTGLADQVHVDSAGTAAWHQGKGADVRSIAAAAVRDYDLSDLTARQVCAEDFTKFDFILAMDSSNHQDLLDIYHQVGGTEPQLFLRHFGRSFDEHDVPDPYYGGDAGFRHVLDLIEDACDGLIESIRTRL